MRWIVTIDNHGGFLGAGESIDGSPCRRTPEQGDTLPMEFRLYHANGDILFEGRCGDIDEDWWHGFEPLNYTWGPFRCRRMEYRHAGTDEAWRAFRP